MSPPQNRLYAQHKLSRTERFHDVIVGAELEAYDTVDLLATCGQHNDGYLPRSIVAAECAAYFHAVHIRQHDIKDDEIRRMPLYEFERATTVFGGDHFEARLRQVIADQPKYVGIVIHDQNAFHAEYPDLSP